MASKGNLDVNKIQYLFIRDIAFSYLMPKTPPLERKDITFQLDIEKNISEEDKILILLFNVQLKTFDQDDTEITGSYVSEHMFKIENLSDLITNRGDAFQVDDRLDNILTGLVYSTVRGLIHNKFSGTLFSNFILPISKPGDLATPD